MSGSNHVVGGVVFTGIYLSMWDINIFSQPIFLFFTAFFSVLPDIDHTKSAIGKMFFPLAKYIDRSYGHRTITHSLLAYFVLMFIVGATEAIISHKSIITAIFIWAYASHLIADMVTKQGVPLFYPFKKNACVLPANPDFRLRSSEMKTEAAVFVFFIILGFSCRNLFENGFWNTYNKTFSNIKHIYSETKLYDGIISVNYEIKKNGFAKKGNGIIIDATENDLMIFDKEFIKIDNNDRIIKIFPNRIKKHLIKKELQFVDINGDSLRIIIKDKMIIKLKAEGEIPINYTKENLPVTSQTLDLDFSFNPVFKSVNIDTIDLQIEKDIQLLNEEIANNKTNEINIRLQDIEKDRLKKVAFTKLQEVETNINSNDLDVKEQAIKQLTKVRNDYEQLTINSFKTVQNNSTAIRLNYLKSKLHYKKKNSISGYLTYVEVIK
jgi:inner membrane protein